MGIEVRQEELSSLPSVGIEARQEELSKRVLLLQASRPVKAGLHGCVKLKSIAPPSIGQIVLILIPLN